MSSVFNRTCLILQLKLLTVLKGTHCLVQHIMEIKYLGGSQALVRVHMKHLDHQVLIKYIQTYTDDIYVNSATILCTTVCPLS